MLHKPSLQGVNLVFTPTFWKKNTLKFAWFVKITVFLGRIFPFTILAKVLHLTYILVTCSVPFFWAFFGGYYVVVSAFIVQWVLCSVIFVLYFAIPSSIFRKWKIHVYVTAHLYWAHKVGYCQREVGMRCDAFLKFPYAMDKNGNKSKSPVDLITWK